ncbi:hypothetical protein C7A11_02285 [Pseudomonas simiae]|nr:hypothetical protein C7A11_02285 [Pseudomonas simiae]
MGQLPLTLPVGASSLAKKPRAPRSSRMCASSLPFFACKLAPIGGASCGFFSAAGFSQGSAARVRSGR